MPTGAAAPPTSLSVPLLAEGLAGIEPFLAPWGERCGLLPRDLSRLGYAVSEVAEAAALLATTLGIPGSLELTLHPFSRWLTVEISYPKGIPLDPIFDPDDPSLVELPGLRLAPDIFWRRIVVEWIDRAGWKGGAFRSSISLTQFAREVERPSDLYFLGLTPRPVPGLILREVSSTVVLALEPGGKSAYRLPVQMGFVLERADGRTTVRALYAAFIARFGVVRPQALGRIVEQLVERGLLTTGERLAPERAGGWEGALRLVRRAFSLRISIPEPDRFVAALSRRAGWLLSRGMVTLLSVGIGLAWALGALRPGWGRAAPSGAVLLARPALLAGIYLLIVGAVVCHELAHALALKRFGGKVHALGLLLYYGVPCPFVDTSDVWSFRAAAPRVLVSLAGPFSDLCLGTGLSAIGTLLAAGGHPEPAAVASTAGQWLLLLCALNLAPFLDTDGYHALSDLVSVPDLRRRGVRALRGLVARRRGSPSGEDGGGRGGVFLAYGLALAATAVLLGGYLAFRVVVALKGGAAVPRQLALAVVLLALQAIANEGADWYRRSILAPIDLKARPDPDPSLSRR